jgi:hypothetical protein
LFTLFGTGIAVTTPLIISHLSKKNLEKDRMNTDGISFFDPPPVVNIVPPPPIYTSPPAIKTIRFTPPVVVSDNLVEDPPPIQDDIRDVVVGTSTHDGENISDLPAILF